jgi:hypothetical protein
VLALTTPFQRFAFEQPDIAEVPFPFNWLPSPVASLVIFCTCQLEGN